MLPLRHRRRWQTASLSLLFVVLIGALVPAVWFWDDKVQGLAWMQGIDKWVHAATFFVLTIWFAGQYRRRSYWRIALGLMAFGLVIEFCQRMIAYRTADWFDVGANTVGIVAGLLVAFAGAGGWCQYFEARFSTDRS